MHFLCPILHACWAHLQQVYLRLQPGSSPPPPCNSKHLLSKRVPGAVGARVRTPLSHVDSNQKVLKVVCFMYRKTCQIFANCLQSWLQRSNSSSNSSCGCSGRRTWRSGLVRSGSHGGHARRGGGSGPRSRVCTQSLLCTVVSNRVHGIEVQWCMHEPSCVFRRPRYVNSDRQKTLECVRYTGSRRRRRSTPTSASARDRSRWLRPCPSSRQCKWLASRRRRTRRQPATTRCRLYVALLLSNWMFTFPEDNLQQCNLSDEKCLAAHFCM